MRATMRTILLLSTLGSTGAMPAACSSTSTSVTSSNDAAPQADASPGGDCQAAPQTLTTLAGVSFVRTPDSCFAGITDFPYEPRYIELDGLRQAYIDEGPATADPILLLHGEPSWSYLYRKMVPVLVSAGHRVIAMDHLGMGRSDKPTDITSYSYSGHIDRLARFIQALSLSNITLFCQDWGSLIGLHVAGEHTDWFARVVLGDGTLPVIPVGFMLVPTIMSPDTPDPTLPNPFAGIPAQQVPFYDASGNRMPSAAAVGDFPEWANYAMKNPSYQPGDVVEALTWFPLPASAHAAYDAPFPRREYMAGTRVFPYLIDGGGGLNATAWAGLMGFTKPFLTIWSSNDPGNLGRSPSRRTSSTTSPAPRASRTCASPARATFSRTIRGRTSPPSSTRGSPARR
jgi:haloalkane dehalogenase